MTIGQARDVLDDALIEGEPVECPVCSQLAKIYKRQIYGRMAEVLVEMDRADEEWVHVPTIGTRLGFALGGDVAKLKYWGLIEEASGKRDDGGRAGYWRVTKLGEDFIHGRTTIKKYALVYNGVVLGFDGPNIGIIDLGDFHYSELMGQ